MDNDLAKYFIEEAKEIKHTQIEILQRLSRIEEKSSLLSMIYGGISGLMVALGAAVITIYKG